MNDLAVGIGLSVASGFMAGWRLGSLRPTPPPAPGAERAMQQLTDALQDATVPRPIVHASTLHDATQLRRAFHQRLLHTMGDMPMPLWLDDLLLEDVSEASLAAHVAVFKDDEPRSLDEYIGQHAVRAQLRVAMQALDDDTFVLRHKLLTGLPGFGKTLLAKIVAHELHSRAQRVGRHVLFLETYAANLNSVEALDAVVRSVQRLGHVVWFIDEIHVLNKELATKLYLLMEDGRYAFEGDVTPTPIPGCMVMGATTDYGQLHPALKRRFGEPLMLTALSADDLARMVQTLGFPIDDDAIPLLVERCRASGAPHEIKTLFAECVLQARAERQPRITATICHTVFTRLGVDREGLRPIDRQIITALLGRPRRTRTGDLLGYGASENDVCLVAGVDKAEFREVVRPRLMARGLLEVRPGLGLALTDRAVSVYRS